MSSGHFPRGASSAVVLALALALLLASCGRDFPPTAHESAELNEPHDETHLPEAVRRELFLSSRHGLQFGIPKQAIPHAFSRMQAMERALPADLGGTSKAAVSGIGAASPSAALSGSWQSLGPVPMSEKANFTGSAIGSATAMTGRLTSLAADATGLIVAGAASGGLWVSTNNGGSFVSVFDKQPTQAIGAIALDTTTSPSTIYVGTGEGNGSIDSLYGSGMFKSTDLDSTGPRSDQPEPLTERRLPRSRLTRKLRPVHHASLRAPPVDLVAAGRTPESSRRMRAKRVYGFPQMAVPAGVNIRNPLSVAAT